MVQQPWVGLHLFRQLNIKHFIRGNIGELIFVSLHNALFGNSVIFISVVLKKYEAVAGHTHAVQDLLLRENVLRLAFLANEVPQAGVVVLIH